MIAAHTQQTTSSWCMTLFKSARWICITTKTQKQYCRWDVFEFTWPWVKVMELVPCLLWPGEPSHNICQQRLTTHIINKNVTIFGVHDIEPFPRVVFQLEMVKIVLTSHFHKKVRATIGLVPTLQPPSWCYMENERTIWERNRLIETSTLRGIIAKWVERPPAHVIIGEIKV